MWILHRVRGHRVSPEESNQKKVELLYRSSRRRSSGARCACTWFTRVFTGPHVRAPNGFSAEHSPDAKPRINARVSHRIRTHISNPKIVISNNINIFVSGGRTPRCSPMDLSKRNTAAHGRTRRRHRHRRCRIVETATAPATLNARALGRRRRRRTHARAFITKICMSE